ncbi:telomerase-binding protein EST1A protein [Botrytis cinerea]
MEPRQSQTISQKKEEQILNPEQKLLLIQRQQQLLHGSTQTGNDKNYDILQPGARPIPQKQLIAEIKVIYARLSMAEVNCIEADNEQSTLVRGDPPTQLNENQWQVLITLHRTLIHEHHDFLLVSQHPSASPGLNRLASKYAIPARMWMHGIYSLLELLRCHLPTSYEYLLEFIHLSYSMIGVLYDTVPAFENTWIECLGDLGRYRMGIEIYDLEDKISGLVLYHHLAILSRANTLQQLYYYAKSLCVLIPFDLARESMLKFFDSFVHNKRRLTPLNTAIIEAHSYLFTYTTIERFKPTVEMLLGLLDSHIGQATTEFMEQGYHIAISNIAAILGFGSKENPVMESMMSSSKIDTAGISRGRPQSTMAFQYAEYLNNSMFEIVLKRVGDHNVLPFIHVILVYLYHVSQFSATKALVASNFPWQPLAIMLNTLLSSHITLERIENNEFPSLEKKNEEDIVRPFPEDFAMRGLLWTGTLYPEEYFSKHHTEEEDKCEELPSMLNRRQERILWIACRIAARVSPWLAFNSSKSEFTTDAKSADSQLQREHSMVSGPTINDDTAESYSIITIYPGFEEDIPSDTVKAANTLSGD